MGQLHHAAELAGLAEAFPERRFDAWVSEEGDIYVDPDHVERFRRAFPPRPSDTFLSHLDGVVEASCRRVSDLITQIREEVDVQTAAPRYLDALGQATAEVFTLALMAKFVPDLLNRALEQSGDRRPVRLRGPSPGARLSAALVGLQEKCLELGYRPKDLLADWPDVDGILVAAVREFCRIHTGFGPVAWEAPGFETADFTISMMATVFDQTTTPALLQVEEGPKGSGEASPLRSSLVRWLEFLEREIWYVRRAFYLGMVPLLRGFANRTGLPAPLLLFAHWVELGEDSVRADILVARKQRYRERASHLEAYGIDLARLDAIMSDEP